MEKTAVFSALEETGEPWLWLTQVSMLYILGSRSIWPQANPHLVEFHNCLPDVYVCVWIAVKPRKKIHTWIFDKARSVCAKRGL